MSNHSAELKITSSLEPFIRQSISTIGTELNILKPVTSRTVWALSKRILSNIPEYSDLTSDNDIQVRSVILSAKRRPTQSMSFSSFDYKKILSETWENTEFYKQINSRFLFMIYLTLSDNTIVFDGIKFWSMPEEDIKSAKTVWERTISQIRLGQAHALPTINENPVAHVRPRAANAADRILAPDGTALTRKCFWLNANYISKIIH